MAKDYAKKSKSKKPIRSSKNKISNSRWVAAGVLLCLVALGLIYLKNYSQHTKQHKVASHHPSKTPASKKVVTRERRQPQFEFYKILPNTQVKVIAAGIAQQYVLQVAALKSYAEADQLKAELALIGFDVIVKKVKRDGDIINRVEVGPYSSLGSAEHAQQKLKQNHLSSLIKAYN